MKPVLKQTKDGIYPRCVFCNGENYALAVIDYSKGKLEGCATAKKEAEPTCPSLPKEYIKI